MYNIMDWSPGRMLSTITIFSVSFFNYFLPTVTSAPTAANDDDESSTLYLNIISIFYIVIITVWLLHHSTFFVFDSTALATDSRIHNPSTSHNQDELGRSISVALARYAERHRGSARVLRTRRQTTEPCRSTDFFCFVCFWEKVHCVEFFFFYFKVLLIKSCCFFVVA